MAARKVQIYGPEPISLTEARRQCFITSNSDDTLLDLLISASREYAENMTWRTITPCQYVLSLDEFPQEIYLPHPPAYQVDKIEYINTAGVLTQMSQSDYQVDTHSQPARITRINNWPAIKPDTYGAVKVTYRAGYQQDTDSNNVPGPIKQAILMMIKHWYDNPEAVVVGVGASTSVNEVPLSASHLLNLHSARHFV